jgi:hypothetical protein
VILFKNILDEYSANSRRQNLLFSQNKMAEAYGLDMSNIEVSLTNLVRLGVLTYGVMETDAMKFGPIKSTIFRGIKEVSITALGIEFSQAVSP